MSDLKKAILYYSIRKKYEKYQKIAGKLEQSKFDMLYFYDNIKFHILAFIFAGLFFISQPDQLLHLDEEKISFLNTFYLLMHIPMISVFFSSFLLILKNQFYKRFLYKKDLKNYILKYEQEKENFNSDLKLNNFFDFLIEKEKVLSLKALNYVNDFMLSLTEEELNFANEISNEQLFLYDKKEIFVKDLFELIGKIGKEDYKKSRKDLNDILFEIEENGNDTHNKRLVSLLLYIQKLEKQYNNSSIEESNNSILNEIKFDKVLNY